MCSSDLHINEIWFIVHKFLQTDARASCRLLLAKRSLFQAFWNEISFWSSLEHFVSHRNQYRAFCNLNKYIGVRKRVLGWSRFCDKNCSRCNCSLFGICVGTFPLRQKLCFSCSFQWLTPRPRPGARYCWLKDEHGH